MRNHDPAATAAFFNTVFSSAQLEHVSQHPDERLHPRDRILLEKILPFLAIGTGCVVDYGCGHGRLLAHLLKQGVNAQGIEKNPGMRDVALRELSRAGFDESRIRLGAVDALRQIPDRSVSLFIAMGVYQYLSPIEYREVLAEVRRILHAGGSMVCTYQNAFFDLYTFNKYTVDFFVNDLLSPLLSPAEKQDVQAALESLLRHPDKPPYAADRARDNIYVRLTNPLTIADELAEEEFDVSEKFFYEYFGLPPLLAGRLPIVAKAIATHYEVSNASAWQGHFMANAFLILAKKR